MVFIFNLKQNKTHLAFFFNPEVRGHTSEMLSITPSLRAHPYLVT